MGYVASIILSLILLTSCGSSKIEESNNKSSEKESFAPDRPNDIVTPDTEVIISPE